MRRSALVHFEEEIERTHLTLQSSHRDFDDQLRLRMIIIVSL